MVYKGDEHNHVEIISVRKKEEKNSGLIPRDIQKYSVEQSEFRHSNNFLFLLFQEKCRVRE